MKIELEFSWRIDSSQSHVRMTLINDSGSYLYRSYVARHIFNGITQMSSDQSHSRRNLSRIRRDFRNRLETIYRKRTDFLFPENGSSDTCDRRLSTGRINL